MVQDEAWFERFPDDVFRENGYTGPPKAIYRSFLALIDRPGKIIELGCGNGLLLRYLCDHSTYALAPFGIDEAPPRIQRARSVLFPERPEAFQVGDVRSLELPEKSFSLIITNPVYADRGYREQVQGRIPRFHADGSVSRYITKCFRGLQPNGRLILFCYQVQLEDLRQAWTAFERELGVVNLRSYIPPSRALMFFLADSGPDTRSSLALAHPHPTARAGPQGV